ncbi:hypothetical protein DITRI_Ditri19aG0109600 [Diplodiscus trichospermus]
MNAAGIACCSRQNKWFFTGWKFFMTRFRLDVHQVSCEVGMGMILRDEADALVAYQMRKLPGLPRVHECEALTLQEALSWVRDLGYSQVIFETDSKMVIDGLHANSPNHSEFGTILSSCNSDLSAEPYFKVKYVRRTANATAHLLARHSRFVSSPFPSFDFPN